MHVMLANSPDLCTKTPNFFGEKGTSSRMCSTFVVVSLDVRSV